MAVDVGVDAVRVKIADDGDRTMVDGGREVSDVAPGRVGRAEVQAGELEIGKD